MDPGDETAAGKGFRVPLGVDPGGRLVTPEDAEKGTTYCCPGCGSRLVLRKGQKKRPHYAHKATTECSGESAMHSAAKLLIASLISEGDVPVLDLRCWSCRQTFSVPFPRDRELRPSVEHLVDGGRIVDVALLDGEEVALAVEVLMTSAVTKEKAADLTMPWIELEAEAILENPTHWKPTQHRLRVSRCRLCRRADAIAQAELEKCLARHHIEFDASLYRVAPATCWKCDRVIPLFSWGDDTQFARSAPPTPRPETVRRSFTKTARARYWANHCPVCGSVQGDFYKTQMAAEFHEDCRTRAKQELGGS